jgi:hypothetical protein
MSTLIPELELMLEAPAGPAAGKTTAPQAKTISLHNTDLNAPYSGGNFDFLYNGGANEATITLNTFLSWRTNFPPNQKRDFQAALTAAVAAWDNAAQVQIKDGSGGFNKQINLRFKLNIVQDRRQANKVTDVHEAGDSAVWFMFRYPDRSVVIREINVFINADTPTLAHELGHVWGNLDEYDQNVFENYLSPGHIAGDSPLMKDTSALMNIGAEFRTRYFTHFGSAIASAFWDVPGFTQPNIYKGKTVSRSIMGRIVLLKKDITGNAPGATTNPFNPPFTSFQLTRR